ncbi:soluble NSF attachment protein, SNAP domain-containing protein [Ditylenchus destructor]|uniref:Soluble NSF attachment protein, SNAP domain-containing protein n=1 Tax=Ditylenchus destructor TaxID=166010 RepID=A0AAD4RAU3_9BILA|nr:soluble NSF attachment protein, SNAP domain-containing protein [Ditylenchus destructor]
MADNEAKARQKLEEAEKKAKKTSGFFSSLLGGGGGVNDSCELYVQAGNLFKIAKNWSAAGNAFLKCAELHLNQGESKHDAATNFAEAGNCFRKVDAQKAVDCYQKTAEIYTDMGRFNMAAKTHTTMAELYENEANDKEKCLAEYQRAADYHKGEEAKSSATKCLLKVAQIAAELEQYRKAVDVFEEVAVWEADHPTLKYAAKTHFFQALLCYLCIDLLDTQRALARYEELSPSFTDSRECKFVKEIILCLEEANADQFTEAVRNYDKISRLEPWYSSILLKIKKKCGEDGEEDDLR